METTESITRAALDTLSSQLAVLNEDGNILFTNRSWDQFYSDDSDAETDVVGNNYFSSVDPTADEFAGEAVTGIREVLVGEREEFTLEYPCHTPERDQWFMMRVTPFTLGNERFATVAHIDITERRLAEREATENAARAERERRNLEHLVDRINGLIQDVTHLLVESVSREEIEQGVCDRLVDTDPYVFAWIAGATLPEDKLEPRAAAGDPGFDLSETAPISVDASHATTRAFLDREVVIVTDVDEDALALTQPDATTVDGIVAIPLVTRDAAYGVLTLYATAIDDVDEREQMVLAALGRAIANAFNALESKRTLTADRIVEMEFTIEDDALLPSRLTGRLGCSLAYSGSVYDTDGALQLFYTVSGADPDAVLAAVENDETVREAHQLTSGGDQSLFQFTVTDSLVSTLADRGAVTREIESEDGRARFTIELPQENDARSIFELVEDRYDRTELVGYHEHERPVQTRQEFRAALEDRLTDRQLTALRMAYYSGFFDWPRQVDGDELATMMDISRSTFHQHLRIAERKVLDSFFEQS
jgi:predicted DNA binding protein